MKKHCPRKKGLSSFSDQLYVNKTDPFAQANGERVCFQSVCVEKRWRSGRLKKESDPYIPDNVSTYKRGLNWLTGNRHLEVT